MSDTKGMTREQIDDLRKAALAATPGPWIAAGPSFGKGKPEYLSDVVVDNPEVDEHEQTVCATISGTTHECSADMDFIGTFNPVVVLALLDHIEAGQSREDALLAEIAILVTREKNQNHTITEMNDAHSRLADKYITERSEANHLRIANRECDMERFGLVSEIERLKSELSSAHLALTGFQVAEAQEKTNGVQLADIVDNQIAEIERLRGELSSARADGMIAAAEICKDALVGANKDDAATDRANDKAVYECIEAIRSAASRLPPPQPEDRSQP